MWYTVMDELAEYIVDFHNGFLTPPEQAASDGLPMIRKSRH